MPRPRKDGSPPRAPRKEKLTELLVKRISPEDKPFLIWDTEQKGLVLQVQPTGHRSFKAIYARHGRPRWVHLADATAIGLSDARTLAMEVMLEVARGNDPAADKQIKKAQGSFTDLHNQYLEYARKKNKSWKQADRLVTRYLLPKWGKLPASEISRSDVKALLKGLKPILANQVLASASAVFTWSIREDLLQDNPCRFVARNTTNERERVLTDEEIKLFWHELGKHGSAGRVLKCILLTGARPGEVKAWRLEHNKDGWWQMPGKPEPKTKWPGTKNSESHDVFITLPVQQLLEHGKAGFAIAERGHPVTHVDVVMRDICEQYNIQPEVRPHDLRRTFGTRCTAVGYSREQMDRLLNHTKKSVGSLYDRHTYRAENAGIWSRVVSHILSVVTS